MNIQKLIDYALEEDVGRGDVTTESTIPADLSGSARIYAKQALVVCGHEVAQAVFRRFQAEYIPKAAEGTLVQSGQDIAHVSGPYRGLLTGERLALNFLMKLSGIATHTYRTVEGLDGSTRIVDTRKTTPLLRELERRAVVVGGGHNHRFALYDGVLIKDNHIAVAGTIANAIQRAKRSIHHLMKIEIEVETLAQLEEAIEAGADVVMLDNMSNELLKEAISISQGRVLLEASGNMDRARILEIQDLDIDVISMGGLIHQARWADISMKIS